MRGVSILIVFFFFFGLLGFLASWLVGFLASWLFGFLASWLFRLLASGLFGFLVVYAAFGGFLALAFRILCIPSSSSAGGALAFAFMRLSAAFGGFWRLWLFASSAFTVPLWPFWLLHPFIGFWIWLFALSASPIPPYLNHHFFEHHGGEAPPPNSPATV